MILVLIVQEMPALSDKKKWAIIEHFEQTGNMSATSRAMGVTVKTVRRWVKRYTAANNVATKARVAREPAMSAAACAIGMELMLSPDFGDANSVAKELFMRGLTSKLLHRTTVAFHVKKHAKQVGSPIRTYRGRPAQAISQATKNKRVAFCRANKRTNWSNVMFTDRKKFLFRHPGVRVRVVQWGKKGERPRAYSVSHPMCVNMYAGITKYGVTKCHVVAGTSKHKSMYLNKKGQTSKNITTAEYHDVLTHTLLPGGAKLFSANGISHWVFQQDGDTSHNAAPKVVESWSECHSPYATLLVNWPPSSPDLNLIEHCWAYVQAKVDAQGHKTFENFKAAVLKEVEHIPKSMLKNLFKSMPNRVDKVLEFGGQRLRC